MRPTVQLDPSLLKQHRKAAGITQQQLAQVALVKEEGYSEKSQLRTYQKIEEGGITSPKGARLIADALKVSVSDLQEPDFEVIQKRLTELMKRAVEKMKASNDKDSLARIAQELCINQDDSQCEWDTVQDYEYAELSDKIEWLYLFGETGELESYAELFGVTAQELRPAPLTSFWLFSSSNRYCHSLGKVISGYAGVLAEIEKNWKALPDWFRNRSETIKATVSKEGTRYRLRFEFPNLSSLAFSCLFYACDTKKNTGLPARNASKWELEKLMTSLKYFLFDHADTVIMEGEQFPPENSRGVFQVRFFETRDSNELIELGMKIYSHRLQLHYSLQTFLKKHGADPSKTLDIPMTVFHFPGINMWLYENKRESGYHRYYEISFGWLGGEDEFHEGPWPIFSREQFIEQLKGKPVLNLHEIHMLPEDDRIPPFEPELNINPFPPKNASDVYQVCFFDENNNDVSLRKEVFENRFLLHYSLQTFLEKHGDEKWRFGSLDSHIFHGVRMQLPENKYCRIILGWLDDKGEFQEGTWSKTAREQFIERVQDLQNKFMYVPNENEVIPSFEPEPQASANEGEAA